MKIAVTVSNTTKAALDENLIKKTARKVIGGESAIIGPAAGLELSIAFISPARIRQLNKTYRKRDTVTDVLSFAGGEGCDCECGCGGGAADEPVFLGELAICLAQVKKDARESGVSLKYELVWVVVHGILHLLGYDHETGEKDAVLMREKEKLYLSKSVTTRALA